LSDLATWQHQQHETTVNKRGQKRGSSDSRPKVEREESVQKAADQRRARAEAGFVVAVLRALPPYARARLLQCRSKEQITRWARKWRVEAPSVIAYAGHWKVAAASCDREWKERLIAGTLSLDLHRALDLRPDRTAKSDWKTTLWRLDRLPIDVTREGLEDRVADREEYVERQAPEDDDVLAPLSADPACETLTHFIRRAEDHFRARELRFRRVIPATEIPTTQARLAPDLATHIEWLVRFQLLGHTFSEIADSVSQYAPDGTRLQPIQVTSPSAVEIAVRRLAALVNLKLRRQRPGRPRTKPIE
jgi:hypothetical protein